MAKNNIVHRTTRLSATRAWNAESAVTCETGA
jgi:hypothetical protein